METRDKRYDALLERCVAAAMKAGSPRDQVENLVENAGYIPYPWQWQFHAATREADLDDGPVEIGLGGARGPGKSHAVLSQVALDDCQRVEGLKVLFLRQTSLSAQESFDDLISRAVRGRADYRKAKNALRFYNGSRIVLGGFKNESDIDKYIGVEYDVIVIEELTQISLEKYEKLRGSLRTSKEGWRPRLYASFNPGGVGHAWVKERFVMPHREDREKATRFIPSTYKQNPALHKSYVEYLEGIGGDLGKAWREGEWDLFAGQYFSEWRYERHVKEPFALPLSWRRFRSIDIGGRNGTTSCHWYALDADGRAIVYREYYYKVGILGTDGKKIQAGRDHDQHADAIRSLSEDEDGAQERYEYTVIDGSAFDKGGYSESAAEIYERHGVVGLVAAGKARVVGWNAVHFYMRWRLEDGSYQQPRLAVFSTCANMIRTIPELQHDPRVPEDVDTGGEDHAADELRYVLRTFREGASRRAQNAVQKRLAELGGASGGDEPDDL